MNNRFMLLIIGVGLLLTIPVHLLTKVIFTPKPTPTPSPNCEMIILEALETSPWGNLEYLPLDGIGHWQVTGITGELRTFQWNPSKDGPIFDLVEIYYRHERPENPLWAAVGVTLPPYYTVYDAASYERYHAAGHGDEAYYLSFTPGIASHADALRTFANPGAYLAGLSVSGDFVSADGVDWANCQPAGSESCQLAQFFESLSAPLIDLPFQGQSNLFIHIGTAPSRPEEGFLLWSLNLARPINLCQSAR